MATIVSGFPENPQEEIRSSNGVLPFGIPLLDEIFDVVPIPREAVSKATSNREMGVGRRSGVKSISEVAVHSFGTATLSIHFIPL